MLTFSLNITSQILNWRFDSVWWGRLIVSHRKIHSQGCRGKHTSIWFSLVDARCPCIGTIKLATFFCLEGARAHTVPASEKLRWQIGSVWWGRLIVSAYVGRSILRIALANAHRFWFSLVDARAHTVSASEQ